MARIEFQCSDEELSQWKTRAKMDGRSLSQWARYKLNDGMPVHSTAVAVQRPAPGVEIRHGRVKRKIGKNVIVTPEGMLKVERDHICKPFKRKDGLTVCNECGRRMAEDVKK